MPVPPIIHYIFGMEENFGGKPFSYIHYLCVRSALEVNGPRDVVFHIAHEPRGEWWEAIKPQISISKVEPPSTVFGRSVRHFAHRADVLRLQILRSEGGIYMDTDVFCVRPMSSLLDHQMVMGIEPEQGLCNAVMLAEADAAFLDIWFERYRDFDDSSWNTHSVQLPYQLAQAHPDLIHVLDEYAFFFPTWDNPSSSRLWTGRVRPKGLLRSVKKDLGTIVRSAGPNRPARRGRFLAQSLWTSERYYQQLRRSYCIHLWEKLWWAPYLRGLSPETLRSSDGLFRRLVRDVLGDKAGRAAASSATLASQEDAWAGHVPAGGPRVT